MSSHTSRPASMLAASLVVLLLVPALAEGATYAIRVRWAPSAGPGVAGYRVTTRARAGSSPAVVDAGLPPAESDGSLATQVSGLDGRTDYDVTVTAYTSAGAESLPSNAIAIGYAQVAGRIDTDGDGLSDAAEDPNLNRALDPGETSALDPDSDDDGVGDASDQCQGTAAGAAVNAVGCSCAQIACDGNLSIWPTTAVPAVPDGGPDRAAELGVKFRSDVTGYVTGIRFYKHVLNTGTHVGNLWSSTGTLLASATFTGESASGWQQVTFATPVAIAANTVYVASYHCPNGHYADDRNYFSVQGVDNPPLHALATGVAGPNGVYAYSATSRFPRKKDAATNHWVDVTFSTTAPATAGATSVVGAPPKRDGAASVDGAAGTTEPPGTCPDQLGSRRPWRDGGIRRFLLKRRHDGDHVTAIGRFAFPAGLDLATSGMTVVVEDGRQRPLMTAELTGADFEPTRDGWRSRRGAPGVDRVDVRRRGAGVVVWLRGTLPAFDEATPTGSDPSLSWRTVFGAVCSDARLLACAGDGHGNRRCRAWSPAAARRQAPRDP